MKTKILFLAFTGLFIFIALFLWSASYSSTNPLVEQLALWNYKIATGLIVWWFVRSVPN